MTRDEAEAMHRTRDAPWFGELPTDADLNPDLTAVWVESAAAKTEHGVDWSCVLPPDAVRRLRELAEAAVDSPHRETAKALLAEVDAGQTRSTQYNVENLLASLPRSSARPVDVSGASGPISIVIDHDVLRVTRGSASAECRVNYRVTQERPHIDYLGGHAGRMYVREPPRTSITLEAYNPGAADVAAMLWDASGPARGPSDVATLHMRHGLEVSVPVVITNVTRYGSSDGPALRVELVALHVTGMQYYGSVP